MLKKRGRQPGYSDMPEDEKKKKILGIRLTEADTEKLRILAESQNKTSVDFTRELLLKALASV